MSKLRLYRDAHEARHENPRDIRMFLEECELWILSRISHHESKTGLKHSNTVCPCCPAVPPMNKLDDHDNNNTNTITNNNDNDNDNGNANNNDDSNNNTKTS